MTLKYEVFVLDPHSEFSSSPITSAVLTNQPVILHDFTQDIETLPCYERVADSEAGSMAVFPIRDGELISGGFCLYSNATYYFDAVIQSLLTEMASDVTFAVKNYRQAEAGRIAHWKLEESSKALAKLNNQMRLLLESTGEGIFGVDLEGR